MHPSKEMDYMAEIYRLFPKTNENDLQPTSIFSTAYTQSPIHSTYANRSSSSDSTSPDSYPDLHTTFQGPSSDLYNLRLPETPPQSYTDFFSLQPQRPIVGRKIFDNPEHPEPSLVDRINEHDLLVSSSWMDEFNLTKSRIIDQSKQRRNYELFPIEKSPTTFMVTMPNLSPIISNFSPIKSNLSATASDFAPIKTNLSTASNYSSFESNLSPVSNFSPIKTKLSATASNFSPIKSNLSPTASNFSPMKSNYSTFDSNLSPVSNYSSFESSLSPVSNFSISPGLVNTQSSPTLTPSCSSNIMSQHMSEFTLPEHSSAGPSKIDKIASPKMCKFCRRNGETPLVYMTHFVKQRIGRQNIVTCPILRSHVCTACGATGDYAHTISYCPILRNNNNGKRLESTTITLKNTRIKSNGKRRY